MTIQEYNTKFYPRYKNAKLAIVNMEHAIAKCDNPDTVRYQLECIGWSEDTKQFLLEAIEELRGIALEETMAERIRSMKQEGAESEDKE